MHTGVANFYDTQRLSIIQPVISPASVTQTFLLRLTFQSLPSPIVYRRTSSLQTLQGATRGFSSRLIQFVFFCSRVIAHSSIFKDVKHLGCLALLNVNPVTRCDVTPVIETKTKVCIMRWQVPAVYAELEDISTATNNLNRRTAVWDLFSKRHVLQIARYSAPFTSLYKMPL